MQKNPLSFHGHIQSFLISLLVDLLYKHTRFYAVFAHMTVNLVLDLTRQKKMDLIISTLRLS